MGTVSVVRALAVYMIIGGTAFAQSTRSSKAPSVETSKAPSTLPSKSGSARLTPHVLGTDVPECNQLRQVQSDARTIRRFRGTYGVAGAAALGAGLGIYLGQRGAAARTAAEAAERALALGTREAQLAAANSARRIAQETSERAAQRALTEWSSVLGERSSREALMRILTQEAERSGAEATERIAVAGYGTMTRQAAARTAIESLSTGQAETNVLRFAELMRVIEPRTPTTAIMRAQTAVSEYAWRQTQRLAAEEAAGAIERGFVGAAARVAEQQAVSVVERLLAAAAMGGVVGGVGGAVIGAGLIVGQEVLNELIFSDSTAGDGLSWTDNYMVSRAASTNPRHRRTAVRYLLREASPERACELMNTYPAVRRAFHDFAPDLTRMVSVARELDQRMGSRQDALGDVEPGPEMPDSPALRIMSGKGAAAPASEE